MKYLFKFTIAILLLFFAITLHAQVPSSIDGVDISISPPNPYPNQNVFIKVESFITDLNAASIIWIVDGKNYTKGIGVKSINISSPPVGKKTKVVVAIKTVSGKEVEKTVTIKSSEVDLVWESNGYVPPFYRGKALFAYENTLRIIAIPHIAGNNGEELNPHTLVYKWKKDSKVVQDQSGYGLQTLILKDEIPKPIDIEVEVGTPDGNSKGTATLSLEPRDPSVSFYEEDPLYGVLYNKELTNKIRLSNQEINIRAVPYTFTSNAKKSPLVYSWSINNIEQPDLSTNQSIILRTKGDIEGSSDISLEVKNTNDILQGARNAINVIFSKKPVEDSATF